MLLLYMFIFYIDVVVQIRFRKGEHKLLLKYAMIMVIEVFLLAQ